MDLLCDEDVRRAAGVATGSKFLFSNTEDSLHYLDGWHATHYVLGKAGTDCNIINATNQRGRISTLYASFDVAEEDRAYFIKHLGHLEHVNVSMYQRPLPVHEPKQHHCPCNITGHDRLEYWPNGNLTSYECSKNTLSFNTITITGIYFYELF